MLKLKNILMMTYKNSRSRFIKGSILFLLLVISIGINAQYVTNDATREKSENYLDLDQSILLELILSSDGKLELPTPISGYVDWIVQPQKMFSDAYYNKRPDVKTYKIISSKNPSIFGNLMITENGIWASVHSNDGLVTIYPSEQGRLIMETGMGESDHYGHQCTHDNLNAELEEYIKKSTVSDSRIDDFSNGVVRNEFSLALVCTGEYYALNGNSDNLVTDKMNLAMLGINAIFEREIAVIFKPIDIEVFRDKDTDPFDPSMDENRPDEASQGVSTAFPSGNYDIGHVFHRSDENDGWGSGGIANLASVCDNTVLNGGPVKAKGWSGSFDTDGNGFISLAAHEFAHMFAATHTFNGDGGFGGSSTCTDAVSATSAYEIGSGTTIMSYQGLCDDDQNVTSSGVADHYFHIHSIFQMVNFINNQAIDCASSIPLNNTPPIVSSNECGGNITIPKNTPFFLQGNAEDEENDVLLYCWEQYDEDGPGSPTLGQVGTLASNSSTAPLFRSFPPSKSPIRYFPDLLTLAQGASSDPFQVLPNRDRSLLFQFTVRDQNIGGGGISSEELEVQVQNDGPLSIQNINAISVGIASNITWNTNNTEALCDKAKLLLSVDGGQTYPYTIAEDLDYASGAATFLIPSSFPNTTEGRLMLACDDSDCFSFFDITDSDIDISSDCLAEYSIICDTDYEVFDQGEPALDLDLMHYNGRVVTSLSGEVKSSSDSHSLIYWNQAQTGCKETIVDNFGESRRITVDQSGTYSFSIDFDASQGGEIFNIHTADNYDINNPCPSFLASNAVSSNDASISWASIPVLTADLEACEEYIITFYINTSDHPQSYSMPNIIGPGNIVEVETDNNPNYSNTFIAVNENGIVEVVSPSSDFTALAGGLYDIYTVSYKSGGDTPPENVDPTSWAGALVDDIQANNCILFSTNKKQISVEFTCRVNSIDLGIQTSCDSVSNTYSQEVIVSYESPPITGNLIVNGVPVPITGSPQTINLTGLISDGQSVGVSAAFSEIESCSMFISELFVAPENCCAIDFDLGEDQSLCDGELVILNAGTDGVKYKWFKDGALLVDDTTQTLEVVESGNYLVEVSNDVGCSKFDVVNITIFETPTVALEDDKSVCEGEIFNLPVMTTASQLQWYKDDVELMGETDGTLLITDAGQYHIIGINSYPLPEGELLECSASDTMNIEYVSRPIVMLGDNQEWCVGDPDVVLDAGQDGTEYTWARNGIVISDETMNVLSVSETGQYTVIVDKGGGCDAKDTVDITFFDQAEVFAGQDVNVCVGNSTTLNPFIEAESFEWYFEGILLADQSTMPEVSEGGEYTLVGYNAIGCSISDTVVVNQVMLPMPDLGDDKIGCIGSEIVLGVEGVGNVVWTLNNAPISMEDTIVITEAGTYSVTILAANDCNGSDEIDITFEEGPTLSLGDDNSYCKGENYTISAETNGDNITWFKDGIEITGASGFDLVVTGTGMYSAIVEGAGGCSAEDIVTIIENDVPTVSFTEDAMICDGESAMLVGPEGASSYQWIYSGTVISDEQSISVSDAGDYILVVENEFGCSESDIIDVIVGSVPTLELASSFSICEGENVEVIADSDGTMFQWFVNGEELINETNNSIILNSESTVEVIVTSVAGCTSMANTNVLAAASPTVDLGEDVLLCYDDIITFEAGDHTSYLWSDGSDGASFILFNDVSELTVASYAVTVTNEVGCTATDEVVVTLFPKIDGAVDQSAIGVCNGAPVMLTASGGTEYNWIDETGTLLDIDGPNATAFPDVPTTYQVVIRDDCGNETFEIVVIDVFTAADNVDAGDDDCAVNGKTVELNATGGISYQWVDNSTIVNGSDSANPTVSPDEETIYYVDITDENGCVYRDSVTICVLDDPLESFELISIITPNGDGDNDELLFSGLESAPDNSITIYNRWGYPVFEQKAYQSSGELWNGENGGDTLPADTYYYVLIINGETYKSPITIIR